jgi:hypothetical protein
MRRVVYRTEYLMEPRFNIERARQMLYQAEFVLQAKPRCWAVGVRVPYELAVTPQQYEGLSTHSEDTLFGLPYKVDPSLNEFEIRLLLAEETHAVPLSTG